MKSLLTSIVLLISFSGILAQNPEYDSALASEMGADQYGMKSYVFAMLVSGQNNETDKEKLNELFAGHQENIRRLAEEGKLVVAGPFFKNDEGYRGLFILDVPTVEEARALMGTDPAIAADVLAVKLYPWYGSAALPAYLEVHKKIARDNP